MKAEKSNFIPNIYTLFLYFFYAFLSILVLICIIRGKLKLLAYLLGHFDTRHHDVTSIERNVNQSSRLFTADVA